jgi:hypothetical protein
MNEDTNINLGDCISDVTDRQVGIRLDEYVYIDTKEKVEDENMELALKMQKQKEDELKATKYQRLRIAEYSKLNQFAMQFDDSVNGTTTWIDAINEIKAKYPKPIKEV